MQDLLEINIRQFEDEDFSSFMDGDNLDIDSLADSYNSANDDESHQENTGEEEPTPDEQEETEPEPEEQPGEPEVTDPEPTPKQTPDQAFAELRRRAEANESYAKWVSDLASQQGFQDPQELINAYEEQRLAQEAQAQGVPEDVYKRLHELEQQNKAKDEQLFADKFNNEVESTKNKYNLTDEQITEVFRYMGQNGYINENNQNTISFEDAYTLANRETLIQEAEERGRQAYLEEKQQKQRQATPMVGSHAKDQAGGNDIDYSAEGVFNTLEKLGIEWN